MLKVKAKQLHTFLALALRTEVQELILVLGLDLSKSPYKQQMLSGTTLVILAADNTYSAMRYQLPTSQPSFWLIYLFSFLKVVEKAKQQPKICTSYFSRALTDQICFIFGCWFTLTYAILVVCKAILNINLLSSG